MTHALQYASCTRSAAGTASKAIFSLTVTKICKENAKAQTAAEPSKCTFHSKCPRTNAFHEILQHRHPTDIYGQSTFSISHISWTSTDTTDKVFTQFASFSTPTDNEPRTSTIIHCRTSDPTDNHGQPRTTAFCQNSQTFCKSGLGGPQLYTMSQDRAGGPKAESKQDPEALRSYAWPLSQ